MFAVSEMSHVKHNVWHRVRILLYFITICFFNKYLRSTYYALGTHYGLGTLLNVGEITENKMDKKCWLCNLGFGVRRRCSDHK